MEKMKSDRFGKAKTHRVEGPCSDDHPVMGALKEGKSKDVSKLLISRVWWIVLRGTKMRHQSNT